MPTILNLLLLSLGATRAKDCSPRPSTSAEARSAWCPSKCPGCAVKALSTSEAELGWRPSDDGITGCVCVVVEEDVAATGRARIELSAHDDCLVVVGSGRIQISGDVDRGTAAHSPDASASAARGGEPGAWWMEATDFSTVLAQPQGMAQPAVAHQHMYVTEGARPPDRSSGDPGAEGRATGMSQARALEGAPALGMPAQSGHAEVALPLHHFGEDADAPKDHTLAPIVSGAGGQDLLCGADEDDSGFVGTLVAPASPELLIETPSAACDLPSALMSYAPPAARAQEKPWRADV